MRLWCHVETQIWLHQKLRGNQKIFVLQPTLIIKVSSTKVDSTMPLITIGNISLPLFLLFGIVLACWGFLFIMPLPSMPFISFFFRGPSSYFFFQARLPEKLKKKRLTRKSSTELIEDKVIQTSDFALSGLVSVYNSNSLDFAVLKSISRATLCILFSDEHYPRNTN